MFVDNNDFVPTDSWVFCDLTSSPWTTPCTWFAVSHRIVLTTRWPKK